MNDQLNSERDADPLARRIEQLQQQERIWFGWVCRLHDVHSGAQTPHSAAVLAIAQRRWAEARRSLQRLEVHPLEGLPTGQPDTDQPDDVRAAD